MKNEEKSRRKILEKRILIYFFIIGVNIFLLIFDISFDYLKLWMVILSVLLIFYWFIVIIIFNREYEMIF